ncbi:MAG: aminoglycoside phosphotransferase family protein [Bacteroidia bacterium]|nr:aminoglycoside phosphotransferase family protein [Bacteroidia bacterium]
MREADMAGLIAAVMQGDLQEPVGDLIPIHEYGSVNEVFLVRGRDDEYVIRLQREESRTVAEFAKEAWCLAAAAKVGIPSPRVLSLGRNSGWCYMIQNKLPGINGSALSPGEQLLIWQRLGDYVRRMATIPVTGFGDKIMEGVPAAFNDRWERYLSYNLGMLTEEDPLILEGIFTIREHRQLKETLSELASASFSFGLTHGDLSPKNVMVDRQQVYLLDWGTAECHVSPHMELGLLMTSDRDRLDQQQWDAFATGLQISQDSFSAMIPTIGKLVLLKRLDKYRWATEHRIAGLDGFVNRLRSAWDMMAE